MAQHTVYLTLPPVEIFNSDTKIEVWGDNVLIGSLTISRGSIDYRPNGFENKASLKWEEFDKLMRDQIK